VYEARDRERRDPVALKTLLHRESRRCIKQANCIATSNLPTFLVTGEGRVVVLDFGVATELRRASDASLRRKATSSERRTTWPPSKRSAINHLRCAIERAQAADTRSGSRGCSSRVDGADTLPFRGSRRPASASRSHQESARVRRALARSSCYPREAPGRPYDMAGRGPGVRACRASQSGPGLRMVACHQGWGPQGSRRSRSTACPRRANGGSIGDSGGDSEKVDHPASVELYVGAWLSSAACPYSSKEMRHSASSAGAGVCLSSTVEQCAFPAQSARRALST